MTILQEVGYAILPSTRPEVQKDLATRRIAPKGSVFKDLANNIHDGNTLELWRPRWYFTYYGLECIQLYLWLVKDWCWSQWRWYIGGITAGCLALLLSIVIISFDLYNGAMSQCWLNFGVLLWLSGNFVWMVGEFIVENPQHFLSGDAETFEVRSGQIFEECTSIAVPFLIAGCAWLGLYYIVRMFRQVPYFNRLDRFTLRQNENMPMPRFSLFFRDYSEYAMAYTFFWCLKDLLWAKFNIIGYGLVFVPTLLIFIDLVYITATHRGQFIEFFHNLICLVWLVANLLWAIAELVIPDKSVPFETRMIYCWPKTWTSDSRLYLRCAVGYLFMIALVLVCLFHLMWICMTFSGRLATQDIQMYYYSSDVGPGAGSHMAGSDLYNADADSIFSGALGALGLESGINLTTIDRHMESGINLTTIDRHPDTSWGEKSQLEAQNNRPSKSTAV